MENPLEDIPDGDALRDFIVHWRGRVTRDVGTDIVRAENDEQAAREYEREHKDARHVYAVYEAL